MVDLGIKIKCWNYNLRGAVYPLREVIKVRIKVRQINFVHAVTVDEKERKRGCQNSNVLNRP